jgi:hypothetical protein
LREQHAKDIGEIRDELRACRHQIEALQALKDEHEKQIETLKEDVRKLVELAWCVVYRVIDKNLVHGIDDRHGEMAQHLAEKHGVVSAGIQK